MHEYMSTSNIPIIQRIHNNRAIVIEHFSCILESFSSIPPAVVRTKLHEHLKNQKDTARVCVCICVCACRGESWMGVVLEGASPGKGGVLEKGESWMEESWMGESWMGESGRGELWYTWLGFVYTGAYVCVWMWGRGSTALRRPASIYIYNPKQSAAVHCGLE